MIELGVTLSLSCVFESRLSYFLRQNQQLIKYFKVGIFWHFRIVLFPSFRDPTHLNYVYC